MSEEAPTDDAVRSPDKAESSDSLIHADHADVSQNEDCNPDNSPTSPDPQPQTQLHQEHVLGSSESDGFRSDDPDQAQFYSMSQRFMGPILGQENHQYDDLPLVFSLPNSEDDSSKVYSCNICNFKTAFKNSLVNHQAVHSDARPWICEICDYAAKRKQDLKKHLQTMHGMIVDSLSLRPGNNPQTGVSSSGLSSPTDTKPVIAGSAASGDHSMMGYGGAHLMNSAALIAQQQTIAGFKQPLPSSAKLSPASRPVVGKLTSDQFPFSQFWADGKTSNRFMTNSSTETFFNRFGLGLREELDPTHASGLENFFLQKLHGHKDEERRNICPDKISLKNWSQTESKDGRLPSVSEMLPRHNRRNSSVTDEHASTSASILGSPRFLDTVTSEGVLRSEVPTSCVTVSPHSEGTELIHRQKRVSLDSTSDQVPVRVARFQSPASDIERCPQVTSQSDHSGNSEFISSTVSHSRALETKKSFHCVHCDILFFENAMYLMHMGLHDNTNPWKCSICGRTFFEKYSFTSHFINQH